MTLDAVQRRLERAANGFVDTPPTPQSPPEADPSGGMTIDFGTVLNIFGATDVGGRRLVNQGGDFRRYLQAQTTSFDIDVRQFMSFDLVRGEGGASERRLRFTPKLGDFTGSKMKIKFDFENPLYVSTGEKPDRIISQFTDPRLLMDPNTGMFVQTPGMITELPRMLLSDDATEILGASCFLVASATNTMIVVMVLIAFSLVAMTKSIWQFINTIQVLAYMRWMVEWPANADLGYQCLDYAVSGRLQTDILWNVYEIARYGDKWDKIHISEYKDYPPFVDQPDNLLKALGVYPILFVLIFIAMIYTFVLKRCKAKNIKMRR